MHTEILWRDRCVLICTVERGDNTRCVNGKLESWGGDLDRNRMNQSINMVHKSGLRRSCLTIEILSKQKVRPIPAVVSPAEIFDKLSFYNAL
jgi:hypothetical protein